MFSIFGFSSIFIPLNELFFASIAIIFAIKVLLDTNDFSTIFFVSKEHRL